MTTQKKCSPALRFVGFTDDWEQRKLGELGNIVMCKRIFKHQTNDKIGIPFYKIGTFGYVADAYISYSLYNEYKTKYPYPKKGDILISAAGTIGRTVVYNGEKAYYQDSNIVWLNINENKISNTFLKYFYKIAKWNGIEGSTIQRLYNFNILSTKIKLPSLEEQTQIGNFFKQLDETIALHKRKLKKQQNLKKFYLEKMFPKKNSLFPEIRFPNFTDAWEQRKLGEIVDFYSGLTYSPNNIVKHGTLVLRSSNVKENQIVTDDSLFVNSTFINVDNVNEGDIIVVVRNGSRDLIGKHAKIRQAMPNTVIGAFMTGIRFEQPDFLTALLDTNQFNQEIEKNLGATINQITINSFKNMVFHIPFKLEQTQIGNFFKQLDETIALHKRMIEKLEKIKQAYLKKMFI